MQGSGEVIIDGEKSKSNVEITVETNKRYIKASNGSMRNASCEAQTKC